MTADLFFDDGSPLRSAFEVDRSVVDLVLHSRSGEDPPRNPDYYAALELLLVRLRQIGAVVEDILVDSKVAVKLPMEMRRLRLEFPIDLSEQSDLTMLRKEICSAQRPVAQRPGSRGGNNHKRIRIRVRLPSALDEDRLRGLSID